MNAVAGYVQGMLIALGLLALAAVVLARMRGRRPGWTVRSRDEALRVEEVRALGPRHRVVLLECRGRRYLLGLGAESVTLLDRLDPDPGSADPAMHR